MKSRPGEAAMTSLRARDIQRLAVRSFAAAALSLLTPGIASASVVISSKPTQNISCSGSVSSGVRLTCHPLIHEADEK